MTAPADAAPPLQAQLDALAHRLSSGTFAIAVLDPQRDAHWGVLADRTVPMLSDFKAPVAAAVLARIDAGAMRMDQTVTLTRRDVVPGSAVPSIGERFKGERMTFTLGQLMHAAVRESDNTAVDALIRTLGGPDRVGDFLRAHGLARMVVRTDERGLARQSSQHPEAAPLNTTTADTSAAFLASLWRGQLLSPASTRYLLDLMYAQTTPSRLRGGLPSGARLADKTGTSEADDRTVAWNDMGLITWPDGHALIVTAYLSNTTATQAEREALFAELARLATSSLRPPSH